METQCTPCGKVLSSPTAAAKHVMRHAPVARSGKSEWGPDAYVDGEPWGAYANRTDPRIHAQKGAKTGVDSAPEMPAVIPHALLRWDETKCICDDHYPVIPAWQMTAAGKGVAPHRHQDRNGACLICHAAVDLPSRFA